LVLYHFATQAGTSIDRAKRILKECGDDMAYLIRAKDLERLRKIGASKNAKSALAAAKELYAEQRESMGYRP
jgi:hypothetical protein